MQSGLDETPQMANISHARQNLANYSPEQCCDYQKNNKSTRDYYTQRQCSQNKQSTHKETDKDVEPVPEQICRCRMRFCRSAVSACRPSSSISSECLVAVVPSLRPCCLVDVVVLEFLVGRLLYLLLSVLEGAVQSDYSSLNCRLLPAHYWT
eukprot:1061828-Amphidinium_carterae.1